MRTAVVYNFLLEAAVMAAIAIVLMLPIRRWLRSRLGSRALCFGWLLIAIRLLCPLTLPNPVIHEIHSPFVGDAAIRPIAGQLKVRFEDAALQAANWATNSLGRKSSVAGVLNRLYDSTYTGMLSLRLMQLYAAVAVLVLLWFVASNVRFRRRLSKGRVEPLGGELLAQYQALCERLKVKALPVWYVDPLPSACLVGVFRPSIALPLSLGQEDALQVLRHELCHYRAKDHWWGVLRLACCVLYWFHPLVWVAANLSRTDLEMACDERVIDGMAEEEKHAYASVLVKAAARRTLPGMAVLSTGMSMPGRKLKARVNAILKADSVKKGLALAFVLLACMALVGAFSTTESTPKLRIPTYADVAFEQRALDPANSEEAIAYAQALWQLPYTAESMEGLVWQAEEREGKLEVLGIDGQGNIALATAFSPEGELLYLANQRFHATEMYERNMPLYRNDSKSCKRLLAFVTAAAKALPVALDDTEILDFSCDEGEWGKLVSVGFHLKTSDWEDGSTNVRLLVQPAMRLIYFREPRFSDEDADRLEPGNG